ncbi:MAG: hypothetical protein AB4042_07690 [Leptolyngbyaceae cyanobacterium]
MKKETKKEIKIYSLKREVYAIEKEPDADVGTEDLVYLEFVLNGMSVGRTSATLNEEGEVKRLSVYEDLDGDGKVDTSDEQIMKGLAEAYAKLQWSPDLIGKKEIKIAASDEDTNGRAESIETQLLLDDQSIGGALAKMSPQGDVTDIDIDADLNGDGRIDVSDEQVMKNIAEAYAKVTWPY